nr:uncharacterized protein LOC124806466 isoform X2 [Hydra vulgaris]
MHRIARNNIAIESNYLGELNHNCQYCSAKKFLNETHFLCCHSGKVVLAPLSLYPPLLTGLMTGNHVDHAVNQNFFKFFLIVFIACLIFFYLSLAAASSVTTAASSVTTPFLIADLIMAYLKLNIYETMIQFKLYYK